MKYPNEMTESELSEGITRVFGTNTDRYGNILLKTIYVCFFEFDGKKHSVESKCGISDFTYDRGGFWVNSDLKIGVAADVRYWIPGSKILHITKHLIQEN